MKLSVSVPDDLWRQNAEPGDSASQVIQSALAERARRRDLEALREVVPEALRAEVAASAASKFLGQAKLSFELGYKCGGAALVLLDWPALETFQNTPDPLGYLETVFERQIVAIFEQRGPTYDASPGVEAANEELLNTREGMLLDRLTEVVEAWDELLIGEVAREGPVSEAEIAAEVDAREGLDHVRGGSTADSALEPFRAWFAEIQVGYHTWAKGFSRAVEDARSAVLAEAHLPDGDAR
jgi:hypothetical protein